MYSLRRPCHAPCILTFDGIDYRGVIENVSVSGTLIRLDRPASDIRPGDTCGLMLCDNGKRSLMLHSCRVVRLAENRVGLELLELGCLP